MVARNQTRSATRHFASRTDGATEAGVLQAFLLHLERRGLVQGSQPDDWNRAVDSVGPVQPSTPADIESAVRKLIEVLREPS